jgi:hypothetical protein
VSNGWMICWVRGSVCLWSKHKSGEWSKREELVLGRSLDSFVIAHK